MRLRVFLLFSILLFSGVLFAQDKWKSDKRILKEHFSSFSLEGKVVWIGKYEVSNGLFKAFLRESGIKVDTNNIHTPEHLSAFFKLYQTSPVFDRYPVVNIRFEDVLAFCAWYEQKLNAISKKDISYKVGLPTEKEWNEAARAGNPDNKFPWEGLSLRNKKGQFRANFTFIPQAWIKRNEERFEVVKIRSKTTSLLRSDIIAPIESYWPNEIGIYNMAGNVAEILDSKKIKGGSWRDTGYYMMIDAPSPYSEADIPGPYVGFRIKVTKKP